LWAGLVVAPSIDERRLQPAGDFLLEGSVEVVELLEVQCSAFFFPQKQKSGGPLPVWQETAADFATKMFQRIFDREICLTTDLAISSRSSISKS